MEKELRIGYWMNDGNHELKTTIVGDPPDDDLYTMACQVRDQAQRIMSSITASGGAPGDE